MVGHEIQGIVKHSQGVEQPEAMRWHVTQSHVAGKPDRRDRWRTKWMCHRHGGHEWTSLPGAVHVVVIVVVGNLVVVVDGDR